MPAPTAAWVISSTISWSMAAKASPANWAAKAWSNASSRPADQLFTAPNGRSETSMNAILTEIRGPIGSATLNRPEALNALNTQLLDELADTLEAWDRGSDVRCMIVTGSERAFAAAARI